LERQRILSILIVNCRLTKIDTFDAKTQEEVKARLEALKEKVQQEEASASKERTAKKYHLFVANYQRTGGSLALSLKLLLERQYPSLSVSCYLSKWITLYRYFWMKIKRMFIP
jgi:hypothetical protein